MWRLLWTWKEGDWSAATVYAYVKTLEDDTVIEPYAKQLKMEFEIVYALLEHDVLPLFLMEKDKLGNAPTVQDMHHTGRTAENSRLSHSDSHVKADRRHLQQRT